MRIAHVVSSLLAASGGPTNVVLELARHQSLHGHECTILTGADADAHTLIERATATGVRVERFKQVGPGVLRYLSEFADFLERQGAQFDIFIMHGSYQYPTVRASAFCRKRSIPYVFMPHGSLDPAVRKKHPLRNRLIDFVYHDVVIRGAATWHFTSENERRDCERPIWKQSFVEQLGIDVDEYPLAESSGMFRRRYGIPADAILLLFLSRLTRKKGIDILLEAFGALCAENRKVHLALCGPIDEDLKDAIEAATRDPVSGNKLTVAGLVLDELKQAAFLDSNYFVLPTYSENFGVAVFEALAYGLPVITTTGMNLHGALAESDHVKIVEPTARELLAVLKSAVDEPWRPASGVDQTRDWLRERFSWNASVEHILQRYRQVV